MPVAVSYLQPRRNRFWFIATPSFFNRKYKSRQPMQNAYVESLDGLMRDELLNEALFLRLHHARETIAEWVA